MNEIAFRRYRVLVSEARRYAWWLSKRSDFVRFILLLSGWRFSRLGFRLFGRPSGALSWPLGLSFLVLNAQNEFAFQETSWVERCLNGIIGNDGSTVIPAFTVDFGGIAYAALRLYELKGEVRYLKFAKEMGEIFLNSPGAKCGCIPYTRGRQEVLVDTLAFMCPFLARLAKTTDDKFYSQVAIAQIDALWEHGASPTGWPYHGFTSDDYRRLGIAGWGRGVGWFLLGIVDTFVELPDGADRKRLVERAENIIKKLAEHQRADGHWPWRLDHQNCTPDSSVTSLIGYALSRLKQFGYCSPLLNSMYLGCLQAIDIATDLQGHVGQCSGEAAGPGRYSDKFNYYIWAQAPAVASDKIILGVKT